MQPNKIVSFENALGQLDHETHPLDLVVSAFGFGLDTIASWGAADLTRLALCAFPGVFPAGGGELADSHALAGFATADLTSRAFGAFNVWRTTSF